MTSDPDFTVKTFCEVEYQKTARLKDKVTIAQQETIPNIWNGTMFGDLDRLLNASRGLSASAELLTLLATRYRTSSEGGNASNVRLV